MITCIHTKKLGQPLSSIKIINNSKNFKTLSLASSALDFNPYRCAHVRTHSLHNFTLMHNCLRNIHASRAQLSPRQVRTVRNSHFNRRASHVHLYFPPPRPHTRLCQAQMHTMCRKMNYTRTYAHEYSSFSRALVGPYPKIPLYGPSYTP
jgi:hypothetical protein